MAGRTLPPPCSLAGDAQGRRFVLSHFLDWSFIPCAFRPTCLPPSASVGAVTMTEVPCEANSFRAGVGLRLWAVIKCPYCLLSMIASTSRSGPGATAHAAYSAAWPQLAWQPKPPVALLLGGNCWREHRLIEPQAEPRGRPRRRTRVDPALLNVSMPLTSPP